MPEHVEESRKYVVPLGQGGISLILAKRTDIPAYVEHGAADMGITGKEVLLEERRDVYELLDLKLSIDRVAVFSRANCLRRVSSAPMEWIPLKSVSDDEKIWVGTKIRLFNVGLNVADDKNDFYDYLLTYIYDNNDLLQLTNLSHGEAGNILCVIPKDKPNHYSLGKSLKEMVGVDNAYMLFE